jgi:hypothetical protein
MSEPAHTQSKPASTRGTASDDRVLAQIEKWMATIREIACDQQARPQLRT